jgi:hypothetical protein
MTPITQALGSNYSPDDIMKYLQKMMPQMMPMVSKAVKSGYTLNQVLGFLSKNFDKTDRRGMSETERHVANSIEQSERTKYGLKMAATAVAAPLAGIAARSALSRALPSSIQGLSSGIGQGANLNNPASLSQTGAPSAPTQLTPQGQMTPQKNLLTSSSQQPPVNTTPVDANITPVANMAQPEVKTINPSEVLTKLGSKQKIDELIKNGNGAPEITAYFKKFHPKLASDIEKSAGKDFENVITEYEATQPKQPEIPLGKEIKEEEVKPIEKKSTVASPQGIGEVLEVRNGQAIVDVDGKKHKVPVDELIESPMPEKELADLYDDLISGIEKKSGQQVSRNVEWAGYDPKTNELAYKPHGSDKLYAYDDISPEDIEELTSLLTQRKSTGENYIGAWEAGTTSPIGAALHKLIMRLQAARGGKGNEYKNRYETIYDALELAKKAAKERHAERKKQAKKPRTY